MHEENILDLATEFMVNPAGARERDRYQNLLVEKRWIVPVCDFCFHGS